MLRWSQSCGHLEGGQFGDFFGKVCSKSSTSAHAVQGLSLRAAFLHAYVCVHGMLFFLGIGCGQNPQFGAHPRSTMYPWNDPPPPPKHLSMVQQNTVSYTKLSATKIVEPPRKPFLPHNNTLASLSWSVGLVAVLSCAECPGRLDAAGEVNHVVLLPAVTVPPLALWSHVCIPAASLSPWPILLVAVM